MRRSLPLAVLTAVIAAGCLAAPASAARETFGDEQRDVVNRNDIVSTTVHNGRRVGIVVRHRDLTERALDIQFQVRTRTDAAWTVYAALDGSVGLVYRGTEIQECGGLEVSRDLERDVSRLSVPRTCIGDPAGRVSVRPRVQWSSDGDQGDWAVNGRAHFTAYVAR